MKILKFFLIATVLLSITSCSKDDDPVFELIAANVAGTYDLVFLEGDSKTTTQASNGSTVDIESETYVADTFTNATITFNANGTYTSTGDFRMTYKTTVAGQSPVTTSEIESFDDSGTFSVNATSKTITFDGDEVNDITLFNEKNFNFTFTDVEVDNGFTTTYTESVKLVKRN